MKRMTKKIGKHYTFHDCDIICDKCFGGCKVSQRIMDKYGELEDLLEGTDWERLKELMEADREKRCVVLPCKKGDTVWRIVHDANPHITMDRCTNIKVENREVWISLIGDRVMGGWNFGKLLFLSEKETEAALKAREQE